MFCAQAQFSGAARVLSMSLALREWQLCLLVRTLRENDLAYKRAKADADLDAERVARIARSDARRAEYLTLRAAVESTGTDKKNKSRAQDEAEARLRELEKGARYSVALIDATLRPFADRTPAGLLAETAMAEVALLRLLRRYDGGGDR